MQELGFTVIKAGALSLLQDRGRFGYQSLGLTSGGAMDEHAACWANHLLKNHPDDALLEITFGNVELEAQLTGLVAVTGASCGFSINGEDRENWSVHEVCPGDRLHFGWMREGTRTYLAVVGGFQVAPEFGSVSTVVRESVGGIAGRAVAVGDLLMYSEADSTDLQHTSVPFRFRPDYNPSALHLRVIAGYQYAAFSEDERDRFFSSIYKVRPESDRMGYRLSGPSVEPALRGIYSEGIAFGAVQIPADGQPIILMKDRQTIGGYPKIGTVLPLDLFHLSQCRAGTEVIFKLIELDEAQSLMRDFYRFFGI